MKLTDILEDAMDFSKYIKKGTKFLIRSKEGNDIWEVTEVLEDKNLCRVKCIMGPNKGKNGVEEFRSIMGHKLYKHKGHFKKYGIK